MNVRALFSFAVFGSLLIGCGAGSPKPIAPPASPLAGNWLITGPMPTNGFSIPPPSGFGLAMTFDVTGSNITASGYAIGPCSLQPSSLLSAATVSFSVLASGAIAADGSFTLQSPASLTQDSLVIRGKVPESRGGDWVGDYTVSFPGVPPGPVCNLSSAGTFTATPFALVDGIYAGAGNAPAIPGATGKPVSFQVTLQQGGLVTDPSTGLSILSSSVLTGSILVGGVSCFNSGTVRMTPPSSVEGSIVNAAFTMNDGSTLNFEGGVTDATEEIIAPGFVVVTGGNCAGFYQLPEIDRQNLSA